MLENFKEYVWHLLTAPFKAVTKSKNCWWALARVIGGHFDDLKDKLMWLRKQAYLATCDPLLLPCYGEDRDMPRLNRESAENYRRRLGMKYELSQQAGTSEGIKLAVVTLGYRSVYIMPRYLEDAQRWAEAVIWVEFDDDATIPDRRIMKQEANKVKPASARLVLNSFEVTGYDTFNALIFRSFMVRTVCNNYYMAPIRFNGSRKFNGSMNFDQQIVGLFHLALLQFKYAFQLRQGIGLAFRHCSAFLTESKVDCPRVTIWAAYNNYYRTPIRFDGSGRFDGSIHFDQQVAGICSLKLRVKNKFIQPQDTAAQLIVSTKHFFDGRHRFDSSRRFNSQIVKEEL